VGKSIIVDHKGKKGEKNKNKEKDAKEVVSSVLWTKGGRLASI
jgi:hypothetical protein